MNRTTVVSTEQPRQVDFLQAQQYSMQALGLFCLDVLGSATAAAGLACTPTSPASMAVIVGQGRLYALENLEETPWGVYNSSGGLPTDTNANHDILKQGILLDPTTFNITAPVTTGYSQAYLIEASYSEADVNNQTVFLYNTAAPTSPITATISTERASQVTLQVKAGTPAPTGTQVTPTPDAGYVGLWVVTVAQSTTSIVSGNIALYTPSPFIPATLVALGNAATNVPGRYLGTRVFTTGNTAPATLYVPSAGTNTCHVRMAGGGGSGGAAPACASNQTAAGSGGDGGAYLEGVYPVATLTGQAMTVGVGGAAPSTGNNDGNPGTATTMGSVLNAPGGAGGLHIVSTAPPWIQIAGTRPALATGGNIINGGPTPGGASQSLGVGVVISGFGGSSPFGGSAARGRFGQGVTGFAGLGIGAGGGGATCYGSGVAVAGGAGSDGQIIIDEYS